MGPGWVFPTCRLHARRGVDPSAAVPSLHRGCCVQLIWLSVIFGRGGVLRRCMQAGGPPRSAPPPPPPPHAGVKRPGPAGAPLGMADTKRPHFGQDTTVAPTPDNPFPHSQIGRRIQMLGQQQQQQQGPMHPQIHQQQHFRTGPGPPPHVVPPHPHMQPHPMAQHHSRAVHPPQASFESRSHPATYPPGSAFDTHSVPVRQSPPPPPTHQLQHQQQQSYAPHKQTANCPPRPLPVPQVGPQHRPHPPVQKAMSYPVPGRQHLSAAPPVQVRQAHVASQPVRNDVVPHHRQPGNAMPPPTVIKAEPGAPPGPTFDQSSVGQQNLQRSNSGPGPGYPDPRRDTMHQQVAASSCQQPGGPYTANGHGHPPRDVSSSCTLMSTSGATVPATNVASHPNPDAEIQRLLSSLRSCSHDRSQLRLKQRALQNQLTEKVPTTKCTL